MNYKDHLKFGLIFESITLLIIVVCIYYFSLFFSFSWFLFILLLIVMVVSPLTPDLDHFNGKLRELWIGLGLIIATYGLFVDSKYTGKGIVISLIPYVIPYLTKHRGIIHSIFFNVIYGGILFYLTQNIYISIIGFVGFYSHLWADEIPWKVI